MELTNNKVGPLNILHFSAALEQTARSTDLSFIFISDSWMEGVPGRQPLHCPHTHESEVATMEKEKDIPEQHQSRQPGIEAEMKPLPDLDR